MFVDTRGVYTVHDEDKTCLSWTNTQTDKQDSGLMVFLIERVIAVETTDEGNAEVLNAYIPVLIIFIFIFFFF